MLRKVSFVVFLFFLLISYSAGAQEESPAEIIRVAEPSAFFQDDPVNYASASPATHQVSSGKTGSSLSHRSITASSKNKSGKKINLFRKLFKKKKNYLKKADPFLDQCLSDIISAMCQDLMDWFCQNSIDSMFQTNEGTTFFIVLTIVIILVVIIALSVS